jgi:Animal haem peroxidase
MQTIILASLCEQDLFAREHNAIADAIAAAHPDYSDERLFGLARLPVAAIAAKIHTIDWTVELLKTKALYIGMNANWSGLFNLGPTGFGLVGRRKACNRGVPYALTEDLTAVYRLHPLVADYLYLVDDAPMSMSTLFGSEGEPCQTLCALSAVWGFVLHPQVLKGTGSARPCGRPKGGCAHAVRVQATRR